MLQFLLVQYMVMEKAPHDTTSTLPIFNWVCVITMWVVYVNVPSMLPSPRAARSFAHKSPSGAGWTVSTHMQGWTHFLSPTSTDERAATFYNYWLMFHRKPQPKSSPVLWLKDTSECHSLKITRPCYSRVKCRWFIKARVKTPIPFSVVFLFQYVASGLCSWIMCVGFPLISPYMWGQKCL